MGDGPGEAPDGLELLRLDKRCAEALPVGGTLLISDQILNDDRTGPVPALRLKHRVLLVRADVGRNLQIGSM